MGTNVKLMSCDTPHSSFCHAFITLLTLKNVNIIRKYDTPGTLNFETAKTTYQRTVGIEHHAATKTEEEL